MRSLFIFFLAICVMGMKPGSELDSQEGSGFFNPRHATSKPNPLDQFSSDSSLPRRNTGSTENSYKLVTKTGFVLDGTFSFLPRDNNQGVFRRYQIAHTIETNVLNVNNAFLTEGRRLFPLLSLLLPEDRKVSILPITEAWQNHSTFLIIPGKYKGYCKFYNQESVSFLGIGEDNAGHVLQAMGPPPVHYRGSSIDENTLFRLIRADQDPRSLDHFNTSSVPQSGRDTRVRATQGRVA